MRAVGVEDALHRLSTCFHRPFEIVKRATIRAMMAIGPAKALMRGCVDLNGSLYRHVSGMVQCDKIDAGLKVLINELIDASRQLRWPVRGALTIVSSSGHSIFTFFHQQPSTERPSHRHPTKSHQPSVFP